MEKGNDLFLQDPFDLQTTIQDAVSIHKEEALRRGLTLDVIETPQGTPKTVLGDRGKVKNIIANVVANAGPSSSSASSDTCRNPCLCSSSV